MAFTGYSSILISMTLGRYDKCSTVMGKKGLKRIHLRDFLFPVRTTYNYDICFLFLCTLQANV
jgi:hypothetical protein